MEISLIIPVRDEALTINELLDSIDKQTLRPSEVVFVDGGSTDETVALLKRASRERPEYSVIEAGPATPGRGRNIGIAAARFEWVALTDAGNRLEPTWLERLAAVATEDPSADVIYGNFEPLIENGFERVAALTYVPVKQSREGRLVRGPFIASSLLRRDAWQRAGGFPDLRAAEDLMFMERLEQLGCKIRWAPDATTWWRLRPTWSSTLRKFILYSKHNVLAGRQRYWHYGIARQYLLASIFVLLAVTHSWWWLVIPAVGLLARAAKSVLQRREGRGLLWALNPLRLCGVAAVLLTIDIATFIGWLTALSAPRTRQGAQIAGPGKSGLGS